MPALTTRVLVSALGVLALACVRPSEHPSGPAPVEPEVEPEAKPDGVEIAGGVLNGVTIDTFWMDRTEVTVEMYGRCVEEERCRYPSVGEGSFSDLWEWSYNWWKPERSQHPINGVTVQNARTYCEWLGKRLPTELEWRWAARGGDEARVYPWGDAAPDETFLNACGRECAAGQAKRKGATRTVAGNEYEVTYNTLYEGDDGYEATAPVGSFPAGASKEGLLDLVGNVSEWATAPEGDEAVVVGGDWSTFNDVWFRTNSEQPPRRYEEDFSNSQVGFRCVQ
jgi:formylglycine-generating enzyme required for sulfatase activity